MKLTILLISILLIGCTRTEYIKETIYINNTIEINRTIELPCNLTCPELSCNYTGSKARELDLIRRISFLENQQDKWIINETECMVHNKTEEDLEKCWDKLDIYEDDIDDLEDELEDCEEINCEYNETWC